MFRRDPAPEIVIVSPAVKLIGLLAVLLAAVCAGGASPAAAAEVIRTITVGSEPAGVSSDGTHVWVADFGSGAVSEIDASAGTLEKTILSVGPGPDAVSSDGTHVWVTNVGIPTVSELDTASGGFEKGIPVGGEPTVCHRTGPTSGSRTRARAPSPRSARAPARSKRPSP